MSTKKDYTRFLALLLSLMLVIGFLPTGVVAGGSGQEAKSSTAYVLDTDGVDIGAKYLIVAANAAYALYHTGNAVHSQPVTLSADDQTATINDNESAAIWLFSGSSGGAITNGDHWLQPKRTEWNSYNYGWNLVSSQDYFSDWSFLKISHGNYAVSARVEYGGCPFTCYLNYDGDPGPDCEPGHGFGLSFCPSSVRLYKQQNPDPCTADKQTVEFWITNSKVYADEDKSKVSAAISAILAASEDGLDIADLVPLTGICSDNGHEVDFWKIVLLDSEHMQTSDAKDDETANGIEFHYIRFYNNQWAYSADSAAWTPIVSGDQLVAYYLEKIQLDDEIQVKMKDWGYTEQDQSIGDCAVAYQVVDPESELPLAEAAMFYNYWENRPVGLLFISENGVYDIYKVTSIAGTYMSAAFHWSCTELLQWQGETDGSLVIDSSKSPYTDLAWSDDANAILIRIYVKKKCPASDNLAVNYYLKSAANPFYQSTITVAAGTVFGALGTGPDSNGYYTLPTGYSVGSQTISSALVGLTGLDNQYSDISCTFLGATLSGESTSLNLYYEQHKQMVQFVAGTGGSFNAAEQTQYTNIIRGTVWGAAGIVVPTPAADNDCHFTGWTCDSLPVTLPYANSYQITSDLTFIANFEPNAKIPLTVTANDHSWVYDGAEHADSGFTVTCSGEPVMPTDGAFILPNGDKIAVSVTGTVKNVSDTHAGNNAVISAIVSRNEADVTGLYMITKNAGQLTVTAKPVTITVNNASKTYGQSDPVFTGSVSTLAAPDDLGTVAYFRINASVSAVGTYSDVLSATYTQNSNYAVTIKAGMFTIYSDNDIVIHDNPIPIGPALNKVEHCAYIIGRGSNGVQPQAEITRAEAATIFFRMLTDDSRTLYWSQTNPYCDVPTTAWYNNAISTLSNAGVINGYADGTFHPNAPITRAEFATMATRFYDAVSEYAADTFTDISNHWARNYINRAAELGLITGYSDGTFHPADNITRAETMMIMNAVLGRMPNKDHLLTGMITWTDNMDPNAWYYLAVQEATNSHDYEISKDGTYEIWTKIQSARDWTQLERQWSIDNADAAD